MFSFFQNLAPILFVGISDYAEIVEDEGDYSSPDGEFSGETIYFQMSRIFSKFLRKCNKYYKFFTCSCTSFKTFTHPFLTLINDKIPRVKPEP